MSPRFRVVAIVAAMLMLVAGPAQAAALEAGRTARFGGVIEGSPAWTNWRARFVAADGRVVDTGNGAVSHSEGQGYGLLLAAAAGDRTTFDAIWRWTRTHLHVRSDGLAAWRWDPKAQAVSDRNNATDGDLLIAWALGEAADLWRDPALADSGASIARDVGRVNVANLPGRGAVLLPAAHGFGDDSQPDGPVVNPSYWIFPAFNRLAQLAPEVDWSGIERNGLDLIAEFETGPSHLTPDWVGFENGKPAPARRFPAKAGYDALRIPLYLALAGRDDAVRVASHHRIAAATPAGLPIVSLAEGAVESVAAGAGYRAVAALMACAVERTPFPRQFYATADEDAYYPATLRLLAHIAALRKPACLDDALARALHPNGTLPIAASLPQRADPIGHGVARPPSAMAARAAVTSSPDPVKTLGIAGEGRPSAALAFVGLAGLGCVAVRTAMRRRRGDGSTRSDGADASSNPSLPPRQPLGADVPRTLPIAATPVDPAMGHRVSRSGRAVTTDAFERHVAIVANASKQWERRVGVLVWRVEDEGAGDAEAARRVAEALSVVRRRIRRGDHATITGERELAVCLCLLSNAQDLAEIGRRLRRAVEDEAADRSAALAEFGMAFDDDAVGSPHLLLEAARADHARRVAAIGAAPAARLIAAGSVPDASAPTARRARKAATSNSRKTRAKADGEPAIKQGRAKKAAPTANGKRRSAKARLEPTSGAAQPKAVCLLRALGAQVAKAFPLPPMNPSIELLVEDLRLRLEAPPQAHDGPEGT